MIRNSVLLSTNHISKLYLFNIDKIKPNNSQYLSSHKTYLNQQSTYYYSNLFTNIRYGFFKSSSQVSINYKKNYYEILHVKQSASLIQIKKSFYKLAKQSHPDTSKGNEDQFKSINQAYNVLSHQQRRKVYDANRLRSDQNINDRKSESQNKKYQTNSQKSYQQRPSNGYEEYINSQQYQQRKQEAYYHYNRGQWQQFRSGYKYHITPQHEYYSNMTNNVSSQKIYQNMKRNSTNKSRQQEAFLSDMQRYFEYLQKIKQKKQKDIRDYHNKMRQMQKQLYEQRRIKFRKTIIGKTYYKIKYIFDKIFNKVSSKQQQNYQKKNQTQSNTQTTQKSQK